MIDILAQRKQNSTTYRKMKINVHVPTSHLELPKQTSVYNYFLLLRVVYNLSFSGVKFHISYFNFVNIV